MLQSIAIHCTTLLLKAKLRIYRRRLLLNAMLSKKQTEKGEMKKNKFSETCCIGYTRKLSPVEPGRRQVSEIADLISYATVGMADTLCDPWAISSRNPFKTRGKVNDLSTGLSLLVITVYLPI